MKTLGKISTAGPIAAAFSAPVAEAELNHDCTMVCAGPLVPSTLSATLPSNGPLP
jgi:hypothetical protein